jgi:hypothetical protein
MPLTGFKLANVKLINLKIAASGLPTRSLGLINQAVRTARIPREISSLIKLPPTKGVHNIFGTAVTAEWPR